MPRTFSRGVSERTERRTLSAGLLRGEVDNAFRAVAVRV